MCIQRLCFGDFHLAQQMKVTRLPGRDPARSQAREKTKAKKLNPQPEAQREVPPPTPAYAKTDP
jgi:hypothetical protein